MRAPRRGSLLGSLSRRGSVNSAEPGQATAMQGRRGSTIFGGSPAAGGSALDGSDTISVGSASASVIYGNSGADSIFVGGSATASTLVGGSDNDLVSVAGISNTPLHAAADKSHF